MLLLIALALLLAASASVLIAGAVLCAVSPAFRCTMLCASLPQIERWPADYPKRLRAGRDGEAAN